MKRPPIAAILSSAILAMPVAVAIAQPDPPATQRAAEPADAANVIEALRPLAEMLAGDKVQLHERQINDSESIRRAFLFMPDADQLTGQTRSLTGWAGMNHDMTAVSVTVNETVNDAAADAVFNAFNSRYRSALGLMHGSGYKFSQAEARDAEEVEADAAILYVVRGQDDLEKPFFNVVFYARYGPRVLDVSVRNIDTDPEKVLAGVKDAMKRLGYVDSTTRPTDSTTRPA